MLPTIVLIYILIGGLIGKMIGGFWPLPVIGGVIGYMKYLRIIRNSIENDKIFFDIKLTTNSKKWIAGLIALIVFSLFTGFLMLLSAGLLKGRIKDEVAVTVFLATLFIFIASIIVPVRALRKKRLI